MRPRPVTPVTPGDESSAGYPWKRGGREKRGARESGEGDGVEDVGEGECKFADISSPPQLS